MARIHVDALFRLRIEPASEDATAGKHERVYLTGRIKDGELKVSVKRRSRDRLPINDLSYIDSGAGDRMRLDSR